MSKRFRCGRLILTKDGTIKKLGLEEGGGTRWCTWDNNDMDFNNVHYRLRDIFHLRSRQYRTSLYDFQLRRLYVSQYKTLYEYINKYGLNANSTVVYLCSHEVDDSDIPRGVMMRKDNTSVITRSVSSTPSQRTCTQVTTNPSTTLIEQKQIYPSLLEYSFKNTSDFLRKNVRQLIDETNFNEILIQLYEYICIIYGYACSTIHPLNELIQQSNEYFNLMNQSERRLYSNNFNDITQICESTKTLLQLNKDKFSHIQLYLTVANSFYQFFDKFKVLHNQWLEKVDQKKTFTTALTSSSCAPLSTSSASNEHQQTSVEECPKRLQVLASSDASRPLSSFQEQSKEGKNEKFDLFQHVLYCLNNLLNFLFPEHLSSFRGNVISAISQIETERSNIILTDERSICDTKAVILSIKKQLEKKVEEDKIKQFKCELDQRVFGGCRKTLQAIERLFTSLYRYQIQIKPINQQENSNWSSLPMPFIDQQQLVPSNKRKLQTLDDDDDKLSAVSCSSNEDKNSSKHDRRPFKSTCRKPN